MEKRFLPFELTAEMGNRFRYGVIDSFDKNSRSHIFLFDGLSSAYSFAKSCNNNPDLWYGDSKTTSSYTAHEVSRSTLKNARMAADMAFDQARAEGITDPHPGDVWLDTFADHMGMGLVPRTPPEPFVPQEVGAIIRDVTVDHEPSMSIWKVPVMVRNEHDRWVGVGNLGHTLTDVEDNQIIKWSSECETIEYKNRGRLLSMPGGTAFRTVDGFVGRTNRYHTELVILDSAAWADPIDIEKLDKEYFPLTIIDTPVKGNK